MNVRIFQLPCSTHKFRSHTPSHIPSVQPRNFAFLAILILTGPQKCHHLSDLIEMMFNQSIGIGFQYNKEGELLVLLRFQCRWLPQAQSFGTWLLNKRCIYFMSTLYEYSISAIGFQTLTREIMLMKNKLRILQKHYLKQRA